MIEDMHDHTPCIHKFKFCEKCDEVYCDKCKTEWTRKTVWASAGTITCTQGGTNICGTGTLNA